MPNSQRITVEEARHRIAEFLGLPFPPSPATVNRWIRIGVAGRRLRAIKALGRHFLEIGELRSFLKFYTEHYSSD